MSLILIPGVPGSGKSHMLFRRVLREAGQNPMGRYIVLVPEQNTLQTQKALVSMSDSGGIWNIDVLSFTRLAYRVFEHTGAARRQILSETGKVLLLRLIAAREGDRIPLLSGILDRPGSLSEIKSVLSEMDQYGIGPEELAGIRNSVLGGASHPALSRKLSEIGLLQKAYEDYQKGHFITGEKLPRVLSEKAPYDETLKDAVFFLDGFTGLTPAQLQVITTLLTIAKDILVTVTIDPDELPHMQPGAPGDDLGKRLMAMRTSDHELFALSKRTVMSLAGCADKARVPVRILPSYGDEGKRHAAGGELEHLERHLFRAGAAGMDRYSGKGAQHEIFLRQCADPWDEAVSAAVTIEELIRAGVRYREIAVVCGSLKDYAEYVRRAMSVYDIPCYIDRSSTVVMNPAFEFVRCAIDILEKNFSYESVMALLRTGLALDPESDDIDSLENYLLAAGIRGRRMWSDPFTRQTRGGDEELRLTAESLRVKFMEHFEPFAEQMKRSRAVFSDYAGAVWNLLIAFCVPRRLISFSENCLEEGREDRSQEYSQVIGVISSVLDEAALLMGGETVSREQFADILRAGFSEAKIGILPRGVDQVQVADLERSRLENMKAVLFIGLNDGYVPLRRQAGGVLTDVEREYLRSKNIHLAPTAREEASIQKFYLYLTLTKPSAALYLSWSAAKRTGEEMRPAAVLRSIQAMFPNVKWAGASSASAFDSVTSLKTGRRVLSQGLSDYLYADRMTADWNMPKLRELVNLYRRKGDSRPESVEEYLRRLTESESAPALDAGTALALYGNVLGGSVTRLEEFSGCAFRHFADYGLKLMEREEFTVRPLEIGNLLHRAVEIFSERLGREDSLETWRSIDDDKRDALAREALKTALEDEHSAQLYADSRRSLETLGRCERILLRSVKTIQSQIIAGDFEPVYFEWPFGRRDTEGAWIEGLQGGRRMKLTGKIDRIDECADGEAEKLYIKIIDYKSSGHDVDLGSLIDGEQLQLLVYLDAAARLEQMANPDREVICAGAFYFSFQDPVVELDTVPDEDRTEASILGEMRLRGLVNGRMDAALRMDRSLAGGGSSLVIPAYRNKSGDLRSSDNVISDRQFGLLRSYVRERMRMIASSILAGEIAPNPSRRDSRTTTCTGCPYRDVCGFDPHRKGMSYREKEKRSGKEIWEIIERTEDAKLDG